MEAGVKAKEVEVHATMTRDGHLDLVCPECGQDARLKWFKGDVRSFTCFRCGTVLIIKLEKV